jgi:hypothetical protein
MWRQDRPAASCCGCGCDADADAILGITSPSPEMAQRYSVMLQCKCQDEKKDQHLHPKHQKDANDCDELSECLIATG